MICQYRNCHQEFPDQISSGGLPKLYCGHNHRRKESRIRNNFNWQKKNIRGWANSLEKGNKIKGYSHHHRGMTELLRRNGKVKPSGLTLSLICSLSCPDRYTVHDQYKIDRPVCLIQDHYVFESILENTERSLLLDKHL